MSQTSYSIDQSAAQVGQLADSGQNDIVTGFNDATGEVALFGHLMSLGAGPEKVIRPAAAADITDAAKRRGVVVASQTMPSDPSVADPQYPEDQAVPLMRKGRMWVKVEDAITMGTSTVNVRYAGSGKKGAFRGAAVSMETAVLANAVWLSNTSGAGIALLEVNL